MLIIGDVHGKVDEYQRILKKKKAKKSVQVGDFGLKREHDWFLENMDCSRHKVLFGNHDYYHYLLREHSVCENSLYDGERDIFYVRGAFSIDYRLRTPGLDWFSDEEIAYRDFQPTIDRYYATRPSTVITHDCPELAANTFFAFPSKFHTRTGHLLDVLFESWKPDLWVFGHYHCSIKEKIGKTLFRCLDELECMEI